MLDDLISGGIIGAIAGLLAWLFNKFRNKDNTQPPPSPTPNPITPKPNPPPTVPSMPPTEPRKSPALIGMGGTMNDRQFPLGDKPICIGTDPANCAIVYPRGTIDIASVHCQLVPQNGGWLLIDFSEAGTWLKGSRLTNGQPYVLQTGDVFYLSSQENSFCFREVM